MSENCIGLGKRLSYYDCNFACVSSLRKISVILLSIAVICGLFLVTLPLGHTTSVPEGYILSNQSDFSNNSRDYTQGNMLYVWTWSMDIDPNKIDQHYCQLSLDGYVHEFYLNPDETMAQPNSFTGSFNLSWLEKPGTWSVQIYLRTSPPKPTTFEKTDSITVSAQAPPTYELNILSSPISSITFSLNGVDVVTPFSDISEEERYTVVAPHNVTNNGNLYSFVEWDSKSTSLSRTFDLTENTTITAYYELVTTPVPVEDLNSTVTGKVTDSQGQPIVDAKVTVVQTGDYKYTLSTGEYRFENLPPNNYTLKVEATGYNTTETSIVTEADQTYIQNFLLTAEETEIPPPETPQDSDFIDLWQLGLAALAVLGTFAVFLLWRSRKGFLKEIKETDYRKTLELVRLESRLKELDNLLQKGILSKEEYELLKTETENEIEKIRRLES